MSIQKSSSPIPASAQLVLDFFDNELRDIRFPDVDRRVLQEAAERVMILAEQRTKAEAALQLAQDALTEGQEQLLQRCQRALAYARIFAEEDVDLLRRLEAISISRSGKSKVAESTAPPSEGRPAGRRTRRSPMPAKSNGLFPEPSPDDMPI